MLLRLAFHDAATHEVSAGDGGANASVQYEFSRPENTGLKRGWCALMAAARVSVACLPMLRCRLHCTARVSCHCVCLLGSSMLGFWDLPPFSITAEL